MYMCSENIMSCHCFLSYEEDVCVYAYVHVQLCVQV